MSSTGECFDIGGTVARALRAFEATGEPYAGPTDSSSAGNGSIMRLAPVPLCYGAAPAEALDKAAASSRTTHGTVVAVDACRYMAGLIVGALQGLDKETLLAPRFAPVPYAWEDRPFAPGIDEVAAGSFKERHPPQIKGSGYVVRSLEAALWAFYRSASYREGALLAVNLGDDADTTGAVYGQIAGAFYGEGGIPEAWQAKLTDRFTIASLAEGLYALSRRISA